MTTDSVLPITIPDSLSKTKKLDASNESQNALKSKVQYQAEDSIRMDVATKKVYLFGNAEVNYEDINLKAAYIEIDFNVKELKAAGLIDSTGTLAGTPLFSGQGQSFKSQQITYNMDTKKGLIKKIITQQDEGYVHGKTVKKISDSEFFIKNGAYTTCEEDDPHFYIASSKLKVISKDKIVTGPAYLMIADVPTIIAIPFGFFPNKSEKTSGVLIPTYGETPSQGFFFENGGYYFALNDYMDLQLRGSIYTRGSWRSNSNYRYHKRYKFSGNLVFDYSDRKFGVEQTPSFSRTKDFSLRWDHSQDPKARPNSVFSASVNLGSSTYYQNNSRNPNNVLAGTLQSSVSYRKSWAGKPYNLSTNLRHSQNTQTKQVSLTMPELTFSVNRFFPFKRTESVGKRKFYEEIGISYTTNLRNEINTYDSLLFKSSTFKHYRNGMQHNIPISTSFKVFKYLNVFPSVNMTERWYANSIDKHFDKKTNKVITDTIFGFARAFDYNLNTSVSTTFYGMFAFKSKRIKAIRHVIIPSINFNYKPDFSEEQWGYYKNVQTDTLGNTIKYSRFQNGIFGSPSSGKSQGIGLSLSNNLEMKVRSLKDTITGIKKIKILEALSFSSFYNFVADSLKLSPISMSGRTTLFKNLGLNFSGVIDPYILDKTNTRRIDKFRLQEEGSIGRLTSANLAVGYNFNSESIVEKKPTPEQLKALPNYPDNYVDFDIPWSFGVYYNVNYSKPLTTKFVTQSLSFNGDVSVTPKWKVSCSSGYDFISNKFTYTNITIFRDLHCWQMSMNWVPFGTYQSYNFMINVKSSVLQDLKLNKRREWYDN